MKTKVFKIHTAWVWECGQHEVPIAPQVFLPEAYKDPWTACLFDATRHAERFHDWPWQEWEEI